MKTILITGVYGNLGSAVAELFLEKGYRVLGIGRTRKESSWDKHLNFHFSAANLVDEKETSSLIQHLIVEYGPIQAAALTAGGFEPGSVQEISSESFHAMLEINFETALYTALPIHQHMMEQGYGRIFMIGARAGLSMQQATGAAAYGLSKSLIANLTELLNKEAKSKNIVAGLIVPSTIDTPANRKAMPDADFSKWVSAAAIANSIYYYSSPEADHLREPVIKAYHHA